jgi:hypothetical protein
MHVFSVMLRAEWLFPCLYRKICKPSSTVVQGLKKNTGSYHLLDTKEFGDAQELGLLQVEFLQY